MLLDEVMTTLCSAECAGVRRQLHLRGYVVVGSMMLLGAGHEGDTDVVLVSDRPEPVDTAGSLQQLCGVLRAAPAMHAMLVWFVNATVPILKVVHGDDSLDLLWLGGASVLDGDIGTASGDMQRFDLEDPALVLPQDTSPALDCIHLSKVFARSLRTSSTFTREAVEYAATVDSKVVLIDGRRLAELMIDFDLGVSTAATYAVKRADSDFFEGE